jgi:hypothetical protein
MVDNAQFNSPQRQLRAIFVADSCRHLAAFSEAGAENIHPYK